jgi:DNA polymerase-1
MTTLLIDGPNLLMRAVWAMRMTTLTAGGRITAPTHVFVSSLGKLVREEQPDRLLLCWDGGPSELRTRLSPNYKAKRAQLGDADRRRREDSFALVGEFCELAGVPQLQVAGMEADDLIAAAWQHLTPRDEDDAIVIVSSDKDMTQMLGPNPHGMPTEQIRLGSRDTDTDRWTAQTLLDHKGWEPAQVPLIMALMGDPVDGVAGVPGIGAKKAYKLLEAHGWALDAVVDTLRTAYGSEIADRVWIDHQLVDLRHVELPVVVPDFAPVTRDDVTWDALLAFLDRYALEQIRDRITSSLLWIPQEKVRLPGRRVGCPSNG